MLEKLFTSKNRVKILEYIFFCKTETYLREISFQLKISPSAVKKELDNLENAGVIIKKRNSIQLNKECNFLEDLKNIFLKTDSVVFPIKQSLKKINAEFILIFGSFARNDYAPESDIDLLIAGKTKLSEVYHLLKPIEKKIKRTINPVVWTIETLKKEKNSGFVKDILKKGFLMIQGKENEFRKIIEG